MKHSPKQRWDRREKAILRRKKIKYVGQTYDKPFPMNDANQKEDTQIVFHKVCEV